MLIGLPFAPESPWWLVRKGRTEEARKILDRLSDGTSDIDLQLQQISDTIALEDSYAANSTYADCFRGRPRLGCRSWASLTGCGYRREWQADDDRMYGVRTAASIW